MTFLPIAHRELIVAARRRSTYRIRLLATLIAILTSTWLIMVTGESAQPGVLGREIFMTLATFAFFYALMAGTWITSDCLSEEKRNGTLGLLFLTDLRGYDIIFGKLVATSVNSVYGVLAIVPVLSIPALMGGVSLELYLYSCLVLFNTMFLSLAMGMFSSSVCHNERKASGLSVLLMLLFCAIIPLSGFLLSEYYFRTEEGKAAVEVLFKISSPIWQMLTTAKIGLGSSMQIDSYFYPSLFFTHLSGWFLIGLSCAQIRNAWQDKPMTSIMEKWKNRWVQWAHGDEKFRLGLRRQLLDRNPFLWMGSRDRLQKSLLWGVIFLLILGYLWGYLKIPHDWLTAPVCVGMTFILHLTIKLWVVAETAKRFIEIRREGVLELLVTTAISISDIIRGLLQSLNRQFFSAIVFVLFLDLGLLTIAMKDLSNSSESNYILWLYIAGIFVLISDYFALIWTGLWLGVSARSGKGASNGLIGRILILPWILFIMTVYFVVSFFSQFHLGAESEGYIVLAWWVFLGIAVNVFFGVRSYRKLMREFRSIALRRYQPQFERRSWLFFWKKRVSTSAEEH